MDATNGTMDISLGGQLQSDLTAVWLLFCAFLVFFMQSGFALLEAGTVRAKNVKNILLKNVIDACIAAVMWWAVGYAFSYAPPSGCSGNGFIGHRGFFFSGVDTSDSVMLSTWLFSFAFSATAATIVSGAVAERLQFRAYLIYTLVVTSFIYPIVAHWVWSTTGWLAAKRVNCDSLDPAPLFAGTTGLLDFAGSGVVHMVGGAVALVGAIVTGPRIGRFSGGFVVHFDNSNPGQITLGVLILWLGWYGFNSGSTLCVYECMATASIAAANTTIAIAAGGITCLVINIFMGAPGDIGPLLNGILAGAVSITASCAMVESYAAFIIGAIGAAVYQSSSKLLLRLQIDDPLEAAPVHFFCGVWGVLAAGLFSTERKVQAAYGYAGGWGLFYGGGGKQLGMQILGIVVIAAWSTAWGAAIFLAMRRLKWLRVKKNDEMQGLDITGGIGAGQMLACFRLGSAASTNGSEASPRGPFPPTDYSI